MSLEKKIFNVLFYKRTNKVHKSKGVAKIDGTLTVDSNNGSLVLRDSSAEDDNESSDGEEETEKAPRKKMTWKQQKKKMSKNRTDTTTASIIFSGKNIDVAKRTLQEDDVIALGGYDVQIVSSQSTVPSANPPVSATTTVQSNLPAVDNGGKSKFGLHNIKPMLPLKRKAVPLLSKRVPVTGTSQANAKQSPMVDSQVPLIGGTAGAPLAGITMHSKKPILKQAALGATKAVLSSKTVNQNSIGQQTSASSSLKRRAVVPLSSRSVSSMSNNNHSPSAAPAASVVLPHIPLPACIRSTLRPHQVTGVDFIWRCLTGNVRGAILGDEMGLGKSLMTIAVICALHRRSRDKQFVVVCPSSLVGNWGKEFDKWIGQASQPKRVIVKKGGEEGLKLIRAFCSSMKNTKTKLSNHLGQVLIISYDLFRMNADEFSNITTGSVALLAVDEGHKLKNTTGSATLKALETLTSDARLCITATPIQNCLGEFHSIANFVRPGVLGDLQTFRRDYEKPISASNSKIATRVQREFGMAQSKVLETITSTFMLRRLQKDVLKTMLPPRTEALLFCRPTQEQCDLYLKVTSESRSSNLSDALTTLTSLRKICLHPSLHLGPTDAYSPSDLARSGKLIVLDALLQQIAECAPGEKVVVVSNFTTVLSMIESLILRPRNLSYLRLDGSTDPQTRQNHVDFFNRSSAQQNFCFLLSSKAGGCGLNLIGANRLIMVDPDYNPASDIQAMGRVYRQGQSKPTTIYRLFTTGTVEEVIYQRQTQKENLSTMTVDGAQGSTGKFTKEELVDCFTLKQDCDCDTKVKVGKQWPEYDGSESLLEEGCVDQPLLDVASSMSNVLSFVHIVDDEVLPVPPVACKSLPAPHSDSNEESESDDEFEF